MDLSVTGDVLSRIFVDCLTQTVTQFVERVYDHGLKPSTRLQVENVGLRYTQKRKEILSVRDICRFAYLKLGLHVGLPISASGIEMITVFSAKAKCTPFANTLLRNVKSSP